MSGEPANQAEPFNPYIAFATLLVFEAIFIVIVFGGAFASNLTKVTARAGLPLGALAGLARRRQMRTRAQVVPRRRDTRRKLITIAPLAGGVGFLAGSTYFSGVAPTVVIPLSQVVFGLGRAVLGDAARGRWRRTHG
jgi:polyferredoxin